MITFQRLNLSLQDIRFLTYTRDKRCDFDEYKKFKMLINDLKVVNDVAERGVILMEEFKDVLTDEEQSRMLLHCVEDTRKIYQIFVNPLWPKHTELIIPNRDRSLYDMQEKGPLRDKKQRNLNDGQHLDVVFRH